jgi:hypothetical protein
MAADLHLPWASAREFCPLRARANCQPKGKGVRLANGDNETQARSVVQGFCLFPCFATGHGGVKAPARTGP